MIKVIAGAVKHPTNRSLADFHAYWGQRHGPLFARTPELRRYVQHHTLAEAYGGSPRPTHDGASMFWYDDIAALRAPSPLLGDVIGPQDDELYEWYVRSARYGAPDALTLRETVMADDRQLFDRSAHWPLHAKRTSVAAMEHVIVDGQTTPDMVKAIFTAARLPGLSLDEFSQRWRTIHGPLAARAPGLANARWLLRAVVRRSGRAAQSDCVARVAHAARGRPDAVRLSHGDRRGPRAGSLVILRRRAEGSASTHVSASGFFGYGPRMTE